MAFDALGYPAGHPALTIARHLDREAAGGPGGRRPIARPASRRSGTRRWSATPCWTSSGDGGRPPGRARASPGCSRAGARRRGRLGRGVGPTSGPGGWAFQYAQRPLSRPRRHRRGGAWPWTGPSTAAGHRNDAEAIARGREWTSRGCRAATAAGAPSTPTTTTSYLNHIPFPDHGALLDPPTADVTGRCLSMLGQLGETAAQQPVGRPRARLSPGRPGERTAAGTGAGASTTSTAPGRCCAASTPSASIRPRRQVRRAVDWLVSIQNADGGWGEDCASY